MISELGFLSPDISESEQQITTDYHDLFNLSEKLSRLLIQLLKNAPLDHTSIKNLTINTLAAKSLELFQSTVILLRKGCIPAAKVLCRSQIETAYKLCAIQLSTDGIDRYINQAKNTRLQKLKSIHKYKQKHPKSKVALGIEAEIEKLSREKPENTTPHEWAWLAKMDDFHNLYYQGMSDDTHSNIESLNHYIDKNSAHLVNFGPSNRDLPIVAAACHRTLINAIEKYGAFQKTDVAADLAILSKENDVLENKYCD
jgi:hypothetical protein